MTTRISSTRGASMEMYRETDPEGIIWVVPMLCTTTITEEGMEDGMMKGRKTGWTDRMLKWSDAIILVKRREGRSIRRTERNAGFRYEENGIESIVHVARTTITERKTNGVEAGRIPGL